MIIVALGNRHAASRPLAEDPEDRVTHPRGKRATYVEFPDDVSMTRVFLDVTHPTQGVWVNHVTEGAKPAWVASSSPGVAALLAEHFGGIEVRDLEDPYEGRVPGVAETVAKVTGGLLSMQLVAMLVAVLLWRLGPFLKTNAGNDYQAAQMSGSASATAVAKWVGLTANTTAPAAGDTTLTGEIVTAGLTRQVGTYAHTTGVNTYTITTTFTAQAADVPITVGKRGIFTAITAGTMVFETLVTTATLSAAGDTLTLTDTVTT